MPIDTSELRFPKPSAGVLVRKKKQRQHAKAWRQTKQAVDARDEKDGAPVCFITGKRLQNKNSVDEWTFRDRAHLEARSQSKARRFVSQNVLSMSRAVHKLFDAAAFFLLDKKGRPARSMATVDAFAWNRRVIARSDEPFKVRKGLAVIELDAVKD